MKTRHIAFPAKKYRRREQYPIRTKTGNRKWCTFRQWWGIQQLFAAARAYGHKLYLLDEKGFEITFPDGRTENKRYKELSRLYTDLDNQQKKE